MPGKPQMGSTIYPPNDGLAADGASVLVLRELQAMRCQIDTLNRRLEEFAPAGGVAVVATVVTVATVVAGATAGLPCSPSSSRRSPSETRKHILPVYGLKSIGGPKRPIMTRSRVVG